MKNKKILIIIPSIIGAIILLFVGLYNFSCDFNSSVNKTFYDLSIKFDKTLNGYSIKEIEDKLQYTTICLNDNLIFSKKDKYIIEPDKEIEALSSVEHFEVHGEISYLLTDEPLNKIEVDEENFKINLYLTKPIIKMNSHLDEVNYKDEKLGLLSINDLHLKQEDLNIVNKQIDELIKEKLNNKENLDEALKLMEKMYKDIYSTLIKDIEGSSLFTIDVIFD